MPLSGIADRPDILAVFYDLGVRESDVKSQFSEVLLNDVGFGMKAEFTAIIEQAPEGGYWAICPEIPGANGQGEKIEAAKESLRAAIELILEDRREDIFRGLPEDAILDKVITA